MTVRRRIAALLAASGVACGARSSIDPGDTEPPSDGGAPPAGSTTASSSTSSTGGHGGEGGSPPECTIVVSGEPIGIDAIWDANPAFDPQLTLVGDGTDRAAIVYRWDGDDLFGPRYADVAFRAWSDWSEAIFEPPWGINAVPVTSAAVSGADGDRIAVFLPECSLSTGPCQRLYRILPSAPSFDRVDLEPPGGQSVFVTHGAETHLVGYDREEAGRHLLDLGSVGDAAWVERTDAAGCASTPMVADAVAKGSAYLVAFSSGQVHGTCGDAATPAPPPGLLHVAEAGPSLEIRSVEEGPALEVISLESRPEGAWMVTKRAGAQPEAVRLDDAGEVIGDAVALGSMASANWAFATAAAGDRLAVARLDAAQGEIQIELYGEDPIPSLVLPVEPGAELVEEISALGAPGGRDLLVAWTVLAADPPVRRIRVARFTLEDCD